MFHGKYVLHTIINLAILHIGWFQLLGLTKDLHPLDNAYAEHTNNGKAYPLGQAFSTVQVGLFREKSKMSDKILLITIFFRCFRNFFVQDEKNLNIFCG